MAPSQTVKRTTFAPNDPRNEALQQRLNLLEARMTGGDAVNSASNTSTHSIGFGRVSTSPTAADWKAVTEGHISRVQKNHENTNSGSSISICVQESPPMKESSNKTPATAITSNKRKSIVPVKRNMPSIRPANETASTTKEPKTGTRKRTRLQFDTSSRGTGEDSRPKAKSSPIKSGKILTSPKASSRDATLRGTHKTQTKKIHHFFSSKSATRVMDHPKSGASPDSRGSLQRRYDELQKLCADKDEQLKAVSNNRTIVHSALQTALERREAEMEEMRQNTASREQKLRQRLEMSVREAAQHESRELRERLAADGARLGRLVTGGRWMHQRESWEEGYASKQLSARRKTLRTKRQTLAAREKAALEAEAALESGKSEGTTVGGIVVKTQLEAREAIESVRLHLSNLRNEEKELTKEEQALNEEKGAHIRLLKRVANEDSSRFTSRPKLHGRYVLCSILGKGGFSEVWRAFDLVELREVAVKIHQLDSRWPEAKKHNYTKHVSREYEIHRNVRHPRIVSLYDVFEIDNNSFGTVLEVCNGTDLEALLKKQRRLPERDARAILLQILVAMNYLSHPSEDGSRQGIIHYDLKPGNILFDEYGDAKITDFGLSKIVDTVDSAESMELTSQGAGTYWYLPPECFLFEENVRISNKVDVWSIGVIFYQMIFGKRPFGDGQSQDNILKDGTMLNAREVKFPDSPVLSECGKSFVRACLTYDQSFRPSVAEICEHPYAVRKDVV